MRRVLSPHFPSQCGKLSLRSWMLWPTWASQWQAQPLSMLRSAWGLLRLGSWRNSTCKCGTTACWVKGLRSAFTKLVSCWLSSMAASLDDLRQTRGFLDWFHLCSGLSPKHWGPSVPWAYPLCSFRDISAGLDMSTVWCLSACAKAPVEPVDLCCASKTPSSTSSKQPDHVYCR